MPGGSLTLEITWAAYSTRFYWTGSRTAKAHLPLRLTRPPPYRRRRLTFLGVRSWIAEGDLVA